MHDRPDLCSSRKKEGLAQIVIEVRASLNSLGDRKNRLIEISADGKITYDELEVFAAILRKE